jgi:hypothetical protein
MEGCQPDAWPAARGVFCDRVKLDATIGLAHDDWRLAASTGGGAGGAGTGRALWAVRAIDNVSLMVRTGECQAKPPCSMQFPATCAPPRNDSSVRRGYYPPAVLATGAQRGVARTYQSSLLFGGPAAQENLYVALGSLSSAMRSQTPLPASKCATRRA